MPISDTPEDSTARQGLRGVRRVLLVERESVLFVRNEQRSPNSHLSKKSRPQWPLSAILDHCFMLAGLKYTLYSIGKRVILFHSTVSSWDSTVNKVEHAIPCVTL
jgi:hypothetical protein